MELYAIYANGVYWGRWTASNADEAIRNAAEDVGTDGDTTGMTAQVMDAPDTRAQAEALIKEYSK